mmetsp:Transcript_5871/g.7099  ORF Transcript_5871/g.7099 Transcript_5871/m.7099 type:complete len:1334 (+) Transcript_5871:380-4381(+)
MKSSSESAGQVDLEQGASRGSTLCCSSKPQKGGNGDGSEVKEKVEKVSLFQLFRFADSLDIFLITVGTLMAIAFGATMPIFAIIFGGLIDDFNPPGGFGPNSPNSAVDVASDYALLFIYLAIGAFIAATCQVGFFTIASERQAIKMRETYLAAVLKQEIAWFDERRSGELSSKVAESTVIIRDAIGEKLGGLVQFSSMAIVGFIVGFYYNWLLTLVICACAPLLAIGGFLMMKLVDDVQSGSLGAYSRAGAIADEALQMIRTVVSFGIEDKIVKKYEDELIQAEELGIKKARSQGIGMGFTMCVYFLCYAIAFWYGAVLIRNDSDEAAKMFPSSICEPNKLTPCGTIFTTEGDMCSYCPACNCGCLSNSSEFDADPPRCTSGGDIPLVFFAVVMGAFAFGQAAPGASALGNAKVAAASIFSTIDRKPRVDMNENVGNKKPIQGHIEFEKVSFAYPTRKEVAVFNDLDLTIEKGKVVALVGGSGCGKSTVVGLLERYYDTDAGQIMLDGFPLSSFNVKYLRDNIGLVGQEPVLFATTIARNIAYGAAEGQKVTHEDIIKAAKAANAYDFISDFPDGFETQVGQKGTKLSGGQKQRIAIARAIIRDAPILILDEATSALDNESERIVQEALDKLITQRERTTIVIAHRLSTVRKADKIVVLGDGHVLEEGNHEELMAMEHGHYKMFVAAADKSQGNRSPEKGQYAEDPSRANPADSPTNVVKKQGSLVKENSESDSDDSQSEEEVYKVPMKRLFEFSRPESVYYLPGILGAAFNGAQMPIFALLFAKIIVVFYIPSAEEMLDEATKYALMFVGLGILAFVGNFSQFWAFGYIGEKMTRRVRSTLFRSILRQEISYFDDRKNSVGALTSRLSTDAALVKASLADRLGLIIMNLVTVILGLGIAFYNGWQLSLVLLVCFPIIAAAGALQMVAVAGFTRQDDVAMADATQVLSESIGGVRTVTAFGMRNKVIDLYTEKLTIPKQLSVRKGVAGGVGFGFSNCVIFLVYSLSFYYGGVLIDEGTYTFEQMFLVFFAIVMTAFGAGQAASMAPDVAKAGVAISNVFKIVDRTSEIDHTRKDGLRGNESLNGSFRLKNVKFAYPSRPDASVFESLSTSMEGGGTIAFVGASGSGKSTVFSLLERFYDPQDGQIEFDDISDIRSANVKWLRNQFGIVEQEPNLFATTIRENIAYGKNTDELATEDEIIAAAKAANAHSFISEFPNGYDTLCGESGTQLSGGQKQRICIARAIIRKPRVLLLDEATAALDNESERIVQDALEKIVDTTNMTTLVVAHRLTTIQNADKIIVMDHGVVVEEGKHADLLQLDGTYAKLWNLQLNSN